MALTREERRSLEDKLLTLEMQRDLIIKSAENREIEAADLRGRAATINAIIEDIQTELDK